VRRVLIVQPYGIGDLLFLTPVFRALRLIPSVETVDLLLGSRTESVVRSNPHIDKIYSVDKGRFHRMKKGEVFREVLQLGRELRERRYDLLLDYSLRGEYAFFGQFFLGIPKRAGFSYKDRGFFHNIRISLPEGFAGRHVADYACELAEAAGIPVRGRFLEFYPSARDREAAEAVLHERFDLVPKNFLIMSPGGGESWGKDAHFKRWPPAFFAEFINKIQSAAGFGGVVILGSRDEKELAEETARAIQAPCANLAGDISLETAAALIEKSAIFAGNDGGLVHLASALHRPVVSFYGPVDPAVYGPYPARPDAIAVYKEDLECRPCYKRFRYKGDCATRECLQQLMPEEAVQFLKKRRFFERLTAHASA
jgi:heptosyltransferase II